MLLLSLFSDKKDLSPSEEWGVDQQLISKLKEQYKKERKSKKAHQRMSLVSSSSQGDHMMPIYSTYLASLCIAWKTSANCILYLSFAFANGRGYFLISSLQHMVLARISKMPIRNSKLKISALQHQLLIYFKSLYQLYLIAFCVK